MTRHFRMWRVRRRIYRILNVARWPKSGRSVFSGNVRMEAVRYADWYVETHKDPNTESEPS